MLLGILGTREDLETAKAYLEEIEDIVVEEVTDDDE